MLFDLRGRGRRSIVRVIYFGLAALIGLGLVGFGVGGGFGSGGLFSAVGNNEGSGGTSFAAQVTKYRKLTRQQPSNPVAWEKLTEALLHEAGASSETGAVTPRERQLFGLAAEAWQSYLATKPSPPSPKLAQLMVNIYGEEGLNKPAEAVRVLQIILATRPTSAALWSSLAVFAYKAHDVRTGDQASEKAVAFAPAAQRTRIKNELAELKANPSGEKTYTTKTNGKTYVVKKAGNGTFTGTELKTTPQPATGSGGTSTTKK